MGCHHQEGIGSDGGGPPLRKSEWVNDNWAPIVIVLFGLKGSVYVNGKRYQEPDIAPSMPALGDILSDEQVAAILTYLRYGFDNREVAVTAEAVAKIRQQSLQRTEPYTEQELIDNKPSTW